MLKNLKYSYLKIMILRKEIGKEEIYNTSIRLKKNYNRKNLQ